MEVMDCFPKKLKDEASECVFDEQEIQRCPFLRNINKPTNFSFSPMNLPIPLSESRGPIFEDGANFDLSFKLFHGKNGVVPLGNRSCLHDDYHPEPEPTPKSNPLAARAATISFSAFGPGGPFGFDAFHEKWMNRKKKAEPSKKKDHLSQGEGSPAGHEALGNEWLQNGNCPIAKSYRAVNRVLPLVAKAFEPPPGMKFRCPSAVVAARAALSKTELAKTLRPQPLPAKMLAIAAMGMAANLPLGVWREHTRKFSPSWFIAVHAAVPFIAMLRKAILMPKAAMALTIAASILGQSLGARAERLRMTTIAEKKILVKKPTADGLVSNCGKEQMLWITHKVKQDCPSSSNASICF